MALAQVLFVRAREIVARRFQGQTMVEYALIVASIGVVAWGAYNLMGQNINSLASGIDSDLTSV
jgi:Flp pilus assembly pilin Flp